MDPDLFITIVFCSWVALVGLFGVIAVRYELRRDAAEAPGSSSTPPPFERSAYRP